MFLIYKIKSRILGVINVLSTLQKDIQENITEIYVGALLFVGLPVIGWLFIDWRAFVALTIIAQSVVGVLYLHKGGK